MTTHRILINKALNQLKMLANLSSLNRDELVDTLEHARKEHDCLCQNQNLVRDLRSDLEHIRQCSEIIEVIMCVNRSLSRNTADY